MKAEYLQLDTLDDRREIYHLLARLHPLRRLRFLKWCCQQATMPGAKSRPEPGHEMYSLARLACRDDSADKRMTLETYQDIWRLCCQYQFPIFKVLEKLVEVVRGN